LIGAAIGFVMLVLVLYRLASFILPTDLAQAVL
jgi:hypothetical protein